MRGSVLCMARHRRPTGLVVVALACSLTSCSGELDSPPGTTSPPPSGAGDEALDETAPPPASTQPPSDAPPPAPTETDYQKEKAWAEAHGVTIDPGKTIVVAKRRGDDARAEHYQDEMVVFRNGTVVRFVASTKPAQMPNPAGTVPDVDDDGRRDLGIVRPGIYEARGNESFGLPGHERQAFRVFTLAGERGLPAWRDTSGDGVFSAAEKNASEASNHRITGILIHYGFAPTGTKLGADTYVGPWSVGCQNIIYGELDQFVQAVGGPAATFRYAIVED
jgi:hypothetical protein